MEQKNILSSKIIEDLKLAKSLDMFIADENANRFGAISGSTCDLCGKSEPNVNIYFCLDKSQKAEFIRDYCSCLYYEFGSTCWLKKIKPFV